MADDRAHVSRVIQTASQDVDDQHSDTHGGPEPFHVNGFFA